MKRQFFLFFIIFILLFQGCSENKKNHSIGFYHWKKNFNLSEYEIKRLQELSVKNLYIKAFDIVYDNNNRQISPVATVTFPDSSDLKLYNFIPCIFIENEVLYHLPEDAEELLAQKITDKIATIFSTTKHQKISTIQIDCDWSKKTKETYFRLLKKIKKISGYHLSATIRLHQVKYSKLTGVPPVDYGVLMCYNMGDFRKPHEKNSILSEDIYKSYLNRVEEYPLKLDVALPIYSWAVLFRNNKFLKFINNYKPILKNKDLVELKPNYFSCNRSSKIGEELLLKGDILRVEKLKQEDLENAIKYLEKKFNYSEILFFHLNTQNLNEYESFFNYYNNT